MEDFITLSEIEQMTVRGGDVFVPVAPYGNVDPGKYNPVAPYGVVDNPYYVVVAPYGVIPRPIPTLS